MGAKMKERKSFLLHHDSLAVLDKLTDEQAGKLFKAIAAIQNGKELELDLITEVALSPFIAQFERDREKYETICKRRAESGRRGQQAKQAKAESEKAKQANAKFAKTEKAKQADSDSDSESDSDSDSDSDLYIHKEKNKKIDIKKLNYSSWPISDLTEEVFDDWVELRKKHKAPITQNVIDRLGKALYECVDAGFTVNDCLGEAIERGWRTIKLEWMLNAKNVPRQSQLSQFKNKTRRYLERK
jgi:hypothetical protein